MKKTAGIRALLVGMILAAGCSEKVIRSTVQESAEAGGDARPVALSQDAAPPGDAERQARIMKLVEVMNTQETPGGDALPDGQYRLGIRDVLEVKVFQAGELNHTTRVDANGDISLPLLGRLRVAGLTVAQAERLIERKLGESYLQNPNVTVFVQEYESQKVTVEGWVKKPGVFPLKGRTTLLQAVALAGGLERLADPEQVVIFRRRADQKIEGLKVNLLAVREGKMKDPVLRSHDVVVVPENRGMALFEDITRGLRGFIGFGTITF